MTYAERVEQSNALVAGLPMDVRDFLRSHKATLKEIEVLAAAQLKAIKRNPPRTGAINWGDLHDCGGHLQIEFDPFEVWYHIEIEEAAPDTAELILPIQKALNDRGYDRVIVSTEW